MVAYICHPCYLGSVKRRISVQAHPGIKSRPYLKNIQRKTGWGIA
jgi:hypothetical protein